jgi:hypothetical protein
MNGFPTVPVHDLKIHPREGDLIAGTHGRSIWIVNITLLQQFDDSVEEADAHLFQPAPAYHFGTRPTGGEFTAQAYFEAGSPPAGANIRYWLGDDVDEEVEIIIQDPQGETFRTLEGSSSQGLNSTLWNLMGESVTLPRSPSEVRDSISTEARLAVVVDSLEAAGEDREEIDEAVETLRQPSQGGGFNFGGGGGGGGDSTGRWVDRPAEGRAIAGSGGGGGGGSTTLEQDILRLVRGDTGRRRRFRSRGGLFPTRSEPAPMAEPGIYTIILKIGDDTFTQQLSVDRSENAPSG